MSTPRHPGQRAGLTRSDVLAAAQDLLTEHGFEAVSMRAIAARLGVSPNALYSHIANKTDLVDHLLDEVLAGVAAPPVDSPDPLAGVHSLMTSTYEVLLAHPDLVPLYLDRKGARGPNARHLGEVVVALLQRGGLTEPTAEQALHVLIVYAIGAAAFTASSPTAGDEPPQRADEGHAERFDEGLRWILAGVTGR